MIMVIAFISIVAVVLLSMFVSRDRDYKAQEQENKKLKEQQEEMLQSMTADNIDLRPLDKESAMEAIRYNGFVPEMDGNLIVFMYQGERYIIDAERFPYLVMMKAYNLDHSEWDMDLLHKAAHQVSDGLIMGKVLFIGEGEKTISFQLNAIENKYGHFKDCLTQYINIIEESQGRMSNIYNEMAARQKENLSIIPQLGAEVSAEKKILS